MHTENELSHIPIDRMNDGLVQANLTFPLVSCDRLYIKTNFDLAYAKQVPKSETVSRFIDARYGIQNFETLVNLHFPKTKENQMALLPRQIITLSTETITCALLSRVLDLKLVLGGISRDTFNHSSVDKAAAIKTRVISWRQTASGRVIAEPLTERLTVESLESLSGMVIDSLKTKSGELVIDYHSRLVRRALGNEMMLDASKFFYDCLINAKIKPEYCFVRDSNNRSIKVATHQIEFEELEAKDLRPPAHWYYPLMLSLFIDHMFLLETYENPRGSVSQAKDMFVKAFEEVYAATGRRPRIIEIPPLSKDMLLLNRSIIEEGQSAIDKLHANCVTIAKVMQIGSPNYEASILKLSENIAKEVLNYGSV